MKLELLPLQLAIARLDPRAELPGSLESSRWLSVTRTPDELSIVAPEGDLADEPAVELGWRALRVHGPLPFDLVGVLAELAQVLAGAEIPIFAISTYDTDYVLVKKEDTGHALQALRAAGHEIDEPAHPTSGKSEGLPGSES